MDAQGEQAVEGRGFPIDGPGGRPGGAPGPLILAHLVGGERGGPRVSSEIGREMGDAAPGGAEGPELAHLAAHSRLRARRREPDHAAGPIDLLPGQEKDLVLAPAGVIGDIEDVLPWGVNKKEGRLSQRCG